MGRRAESSDDDSPTSQCPPRSDISYLRREESNRKALQVHVGMWIKVGTERRPRPKYLTRRTGKETRDEGEAREGRMETRNG